MGYKRKEILCVCVWERERNCVLISHMILLIINKVARFFKMRENSLPTLSTKTPKWSSEERQDRLEGSFPFFFSVTNMTWIHNLKAAVSIFHCATLLLMEICLQIGWVGSGRYYCSGIQVRLKMFYFLELSKVLKLVLRPNCLPPRLKFDRLRTRLAWVQWFNRNLLRYGRANLTLLCQILKLQWYPRISHSSPLIPQPEDYPMSHWARGHRLATYVSFPEVLSKQNLTKCR